MRHLVALTVGLCLVAILLWMIIIAAFISAPQTACAATEESFLALIRNARGDRIPTSPLLMKIAERRANEIVTNYSHEGHDPRFAEVLVWNSYPEDLTEAAAVSQLLGSAGHKSIILGDYNAIGVGVVDAVPKHFYAAVFASFSSGAQSAPRQLPATDC